MFNWIEYVFLLTRKFLSETVTNPLV